ncbi:hypothetical protein E1286_36310 [Nonomuraea terrae]|uniref:Uncharacterized protein n=1 Tax=Nonomuraea terrae TaxID=2530383 RepID=A0A4V6PDL4_9ACTN|nr:hypothetical protein [Nonomuraea terrae]TDD38407.1 hypothetical protein E1286_36310 [Nonomuraea terrae]
MLVSFVRISMIAAIGCVASLTQSTASADTPLRERSALARLLGGIDLNSALSTPAENRLIAYNSSMPDSPTTVSGPANSGISTNSGKYFNEGIPINSGDVSNNNGVFDP